MSVNNIQDYFDNRQKLSLTALEIDNMKLNSKVGELQKKNKQLSRDILNYSLFKERYQQALAVTGSKKDAEAGQILSLQKIEQLRVRYPQLYQVQLQIHYKNRMELSAREWKDKLYEIVHKYEDQMEVIKEREAGLVIQKQELEKKIFVLANQKYKLENKLIESENQIYQLLKTYKNLSSMNVKESQSIRSSQND